MEDGLRFSLTPFPQTIEDFEMLKVLAKGGYTKVYIINLMQ